MSQQQTGLLHGADGISYDFPASTENVEIFIAGIHGFLAERALGGLAFDIELLAREALVNAVQHGSRCDASKLVSASLRLEGAALVLTVRDQGAGWDWRNMPIATPDPARESGRGLIIIRKYADSFAYNDSGNALTITKRVPSEDTNMTTPQDGTVRLAMEPRVSAQDVPALREVFRARIQEGARQLHLDFSRVESLDSMGIGLLVATHNSLAKQGGALVLSEVRKDIHQLLTLMRLDKHFSITPAPGSPAQGDTVQAG
ncbi:MAG TPA: ATP-binding protein [Humidesulfovibrio sp.]|uniref:ATP-binding protein n=1 Tax=Humidesulfovibrio sp. TaxID=2910988 RepID=UPI002B86E630|nr:ATP-binding protein [Humidesulfovibrio sp.]HWR02541.1 ATP-binding protein [Humidesulfovibrio sp.]